MGTSVRVVRRLDSSDRKRDNSVGGDRRKGGAVIVEGGGWRRD